MTRKDTNVHDFQFFLFVLLLPLNVKNKEFLYTANFSLTKICPHLIFPLDGVQKKLSLQCQFQSNTFYSKSKGKNNI